MVFLITLALYLYVCFSPVSLTSICMAKLADMLSSRVPQKQQPPAASSCWIPSFLLPRCSPPPPPPPPRGLDWAKSIATSWLPSAFTKSTTATRFWQKLLPQQRNGLLRSEHVVTLNLVVGVITACIHIWVWWAYSRPSGMAETEEEEEEEYVYRPYQSAATTIEDGIIKTKPGPTYRSTTYRYAGEKEASSSVQSRLRSFAGGVWRLARVAMSYRTDLLGPIMALSALSAAVISLVVSGGSLAVAFSLYQCALFGAPFFYLMW